VVLLWWWLGPALRRTRVRLAGSWLWGWSLLAAGGVPLSALGRVSAWVCLASGAALFACGIAALLSRHGRRAGDVLLIGALAVVLLWSFWRVGGLAQVSYAVLVLTVTGLGIRSALRPTPPPRTP
jgi:hypothetical protein